MKENKNSLKRFLIDFIVYEPVGIILSIVLSITITVVCTSIIYTIFNEMIPTIFIITFFIISNIIIIFYSHYSKYKEEKTIKRIIIERKKQLLKINEKFFV